MSNEEDPGNTNQSNPSNSSDVNSRGGTTQQGKCGTTSTPSHMETPFIQQLVHDQNSGRDGQKRLSAREPITGDRNRRVSKYIL